ncbi:MAG: hypothetical protein [Olavius algarvensis Gamma 1 endosymbiont]|nr:MAG: hypothetical protein [Olavius algarvensis Gamma 1 endosymbiont]
MPFSLHRNIERIVVRTRCGRDARGPRGGGVPGARYAGSAGILPAL